MKQANRRNIGITIDVESDWGGRVRDSYGIEYGLPYILKLLESLEIKATFFISGVVAAKHKDIICTISESGHEIASHSLTHKNHSILTKEKLYEDIGKSKQLIEDEIGVKPLGFRVPQFRVNEELFDVVSNLDFKYDSSTIRSAFPTRYSGLSTPNEPFLLKNGLLEIPVSAMPYIKIPFGLRWVNVVGFTTFKFLLETFTLPQAIIFYLHPFDVIDPANHPELNKQLKYFIIKRWYLYKSDSVRDTLKQILNYWKKKDEKFILLKDISIKDK
jgi:peptidoglycan/xylan/chitin deacetylase (PgdA/CDA1 family)